MIIFMGVAGSGKSVQGRMLADKLQLPWLSTGEFLRMLVAGERRQQMIAGKLLDDQEIIMMVQKIFRVIEADKEFVLDGFPRTPAQADWLLSQVKHGQLNVTAVIHLQASEAEVQKRLLSRGRPDDTKEAISERFLEYRQSILPILDHFKEAGIKVHTVDAEQPVDVIHNEILKAVE